MTLAQVMALVDLDALSRPDAGQAVTAPLSEAEMMLAGPVGTVDDLRVLQRAEDRRRGVKKRG